MSLYTSYLCSNWKGKGDKIPQTWALCNLNHILCIDLDRRSGSAWVTYYWDPYFWGAIVSWDFCNFIIFIKITGTGTHFDFWRLPQLVNFDRHIICVTSLGIDALELSISSSTDQKEFWVLAFTYLGDYHVVENCEEDEHNHDHNNNDDCFRVVTGFFFRNRSRKSWFEQCAILLLFVCLFQIVLSEIHISINDGWAFEKINGIQWTN